MKGGLVALEITSSKEKIFTSFRSKMDASVHAATPLVIADKIFLSTCYGVGASLWRDVKRDNNKINRLVEQKWPLKERMDCHYSTPVSHKGFICGVHGLQESHTELRCIEISTGKLQ